MATVAQTCADLIRRFPTRYANRTQVLHHLFLVPGNGYRWRGGELVDPADDRRADEDATDPVMAVLDDVFGTDHPVTVTSRAAVAAQREPHLWRREQADTLAVTPGPLDLDAIHPYSPGCALATMPADVTDDWRTAAREIVAAVDA